MSGVLTQDRHTVTWAAWLLALILCLSFTLPTSVAAQQPEVQGWTVSGDVSNGTPGGTVPDDLMVTLHTFSDAEEISNYTATVNAGGSFRFEDVTLNSGQTVVARTVYEGVPYVSEFISLEEAEGEISLSLTIYEVTEDPADVEIAQLHIFVTPGDNRVQLAEYVMLENDGSRAYVGTPLETESGPSRKTWSVKLPDGASNLQFEHGDLGGRFVPTEDGFADSRPIVPGDASVESTFIYELVPQEGMRIEQSMNVPVRGAVLVMMHEAGELQGDGLSGGEIVETQMGRAVSYAAGPLNAGERLVFRIVPREATAPGPTSFSSWRGLVAGIGALLAAGAAVIAMWRTPSPGPVPAAVRDEIAALAALDQAHEQGLLSENTYREKRHSLKQRVRQKLSADCEGREP